MVYSCTDVYVKIRTYEISVNMGWFKYGVKQGRAQPGVKAVPKKTTPGAKVAYAGHRAGQAVGSGISRGFTGGAVLLGHGVNKGYYGTQAAIRNVNKHSLAMHRRMTPGLQYANRKAKAARARIRSGVKSGRRRVQRYRDNRSNKKKKKRARQQEYVRDEALKTLGLFDAYQNLGKVNTKPYPQTGFTQVFMDQNFDFGQELNRQRDRLRAAPPNALRLTYG